MINAGRTIVLTAMFAAALALALAVVWDVGVRMPEAGGNLTMKEKTPPYHHDPAGGFRNLPGAPLRTATAGDMSKFVAEGLFSTKEIEVPDSHILPREQVLQQMADASNPSVTWLGHASFIVRISHDHYDHLDAHAIKHYGYKDTTQVIVPLGLGPFFTKRGYPNVLEQDWWDTWEHDGLSITALPAVHFSGRGLFDRDQTLWASFAFKSASESIWFSGDTASGEVFSEIGKRHGPFDLALVAIGAYDPRSIMRDVHVSPEEAVEVARQVGAKQAIGMHWGTIRLTSEDAFEPPARFSQAAIEQDFGAENAHVLSIGETYELPHQDAQGAEAA